MKKGVEAALGRRQEQLVSTSSISDNVSHYTIYRISINNEIISIVFYCGLL